MHRMLVLALCLLLMVSKIASQEHRLALVIGNAKYDDKPLSNPENDADDMSRVLKELGFEVIVRKNAPFHDMEDAIVEFSQKIQDSKTIALFYYAGHGVQVEDKNYLLPVKTKITGAETLKRNAVSLDNLMAMLSDAKGLLNIVILDACRDNPFRSMGGRTGRTLGGTRGLVGVTGKGQMMIVYATAPGKEALDGTGRNGTFTKHLLENIKSQEDISLMLRKVREGVKQETGGAQEPWDSSSLTQGFRFNTKENIVPVLPQQYIYGLPKEIWDTCKYNNEGEWILDMASDRWGKLSFGKQVEYARAYQRGYAIARGLEVEKIFVTEVIEKGWVWDAKKKMEMVFRLIPPGRFYMGSPEGETDRGNDETRHRVIISKAFYVGKYEVTQGQWQAAMGNNPAAFKDSGSNAPVETVSWNDCQKFCENTGFKLPTEAQWEYACRAGTTTPFSLGENITPDQVNYDGNYPYAGGAKGEYRVKTVACGSLPNENAWGCYDFHGNVLEWCEDYYNSDLYKNRDNISDPLYQNKGASCVLRGGYWFYYAQRCRSALRACLDASIAFSDWGLRAVRSLP